MRLQENKGGGITIELKDMNKADHDEAEQARKTAALKKGLSD
jgi:hypothetical protein